MMPRFSRRGDDLSTPRRGLSLGVHYDPEAFGRFSEAIARTLGTARFLVLQTGIVAVWVNGESVWRDGESTGARPGRALRRQQMQIALS